MNDARQDIAAVAVTRSLLRPVYVSTQSVLAGSKNIPTKHCAYSGSVAQVGSLVLLQTHVPPLSARIID